MNRFAIRGCGNVQYVTRGPADMPLPPDVVGEPGGWVRWGDRYGRLYTAWESRVGGAVVTVQGVQFDDGRTELIVCCDQSEDMTAQQARDLAAALIAAAARLDAHR